MALSNGSKYLTSPSEIPVKASGSEIEKTLGEWVEGQVYTYDSVSDMVSDEELREGGVVQTLGYYSKGDGGAAKYEIVPAGTSANEDVVIDLSASGLQARLLAYGSVSVKACGAEGDDSNDDTNAFQAAHDLMYLQGGGTVTIPAGMYRIQGVKFKSGVHWEGLSQSGSSIRAVIDPAPGVGLFEVENEDEGPLEGIVFKNLTIEGDGVSNLYIPSGATVPGITFRTNTSEHQLQQCYFENLFIRYCTVGLYLWNSVRYTPMTACRFWNNDVGLTIGNEHAAMYACEFRFNDVGVNGVIQDMDMVASKWTYNRVGFEAGMSRSNMSACIFYQNKEIGIRNILEYNTFSGCLFRGAGSFWEEIHGDPNESVIIGVRGRGTTINSSLFWGGNGKAAVEFQSDNVQYGFNISDCPVVVDEGHFFEKTGAGGVTGFTVADCSFFVSSVGDAAGGMILRVPSDASGTLSGVKFTDNFVRNMGGAVQTHNFIELLQPLSSSNTIKGNTFQPQSGTCGGIEVANSTKGIYTENTFLSGNYVDKLKVSPALDMVVKNNAGFTTERSGIVNFGIGDDEVTVDHGLDLIPADSCFTLTLAGSSGGGNISKVWISDISSTSLTVKSDVATTTGAIVYWSVSAHRFI